MKSLRYLAVLPLMAAAAQALTLDVQLGYGKPNAPLSGGASADNTSVVGLGIGTYLTENSHLGLNLSTRDIVTADPDSAGSQFFVCHGRAPHLDNQYTAFGKVVVGEEVLNKIANIPCVGMERSTPTERVEITSVEIVEAK